MLYASRPRRAGAAKFSRDSAARPSCYYTGRPRQNYKTIITIITPSNTTRAVRLLDLDRKRATRVLDTQGSGSGNYTLTVARRRRTANNPRAQTTPSRGPNESVVIREIIVARYRYPRSAQGLGFIIIIIIVVIINKYRVCACVRAGTRLV